MFDTLWQHLPGVPVWLMRQDIRMCLLAATYKIGGLWHLVIKGIDKTALPTSQSYHDIWYDVINLLASVKCHIDINS